MTIKPGVVGLFNYNTATIFWKKSLILSCEKTVSVSLKTIALASSISKYNHSQ
jgi:hypothetical protein